MRLVLCLCVALGLPAQRLPEARAETEPGKGPREMRGQQERDRRARVVEEMRKQYFLKHSTKPAVRESPPNSVIPHRLTVDGKPVFVFGVNYPFFNCLRGVDIGPFGAWEKLPSTNLGLPPLKAGESAFNAEQMEEQFADMESAGVKVIRWGWGFDGRGFYDFDQNMVCRGIHPLTLKNLSQVLDLARKHNLRIWAVLLDFRFVRFGPQGGHKDRYSAVMRSPEKRRALVEAFGKLAEFCKGRKELFCFEIMNEASNVIEGRDAVTGYSLLHRDEFDSEETRILAKNRIELALMQQFMNEAYDAIKKADPDRRVLCSSLNHVGYLPGFVGRVKSDFYAAHYNANGWTDYGRTHTVEDIQRDLLDRWSLKLDKPLVMGEAPSELNRNMDYFLEAAYKGGWAGFLPWSWCEMIGVFEAPYPKAPRIPKPAPKEIELFRQWSQQHAQEIDFGPSGEQPREQIRRAAPLGDDRAKGSLKDDIKQAKSVMWIGAHPDDELYMGGTLGYSGIRGTHSCGRPRIPAPCDATGRPLHDDLP